MGHGPSLHPLVPPNAEQAQMFVFAARTSLVAPQTLLELGLLPCFATCFNGLGICVALNPFMIWGLDTVPHGKTVQRVGYKFVCLLDVMGEHQYLRMVFLPLSSKRNISCERCVQKTPTSMASWSRTG